MLNNSEADRCCSYQKGQDRLHVNTYGLLDAQESLSRSFADGAPYPSSFSSARLTKSNSCLSVFLLAVRLYRPCHCLSHPSQPRPQLGLQSRPLLFSEPSGSPNSRSKVSIVLVPRLALPSCSEPLEPSIISSATRMSTACHAINPPSLPTLTRPTGSKCRCQPSLSPLQSTGWTWSSPWPPGWASTTWTSSSSCGRCLPRTTSCSRPSRPR
jgi:hypothetical protein